MSDRIGAQRNLRTIEADHKTDVLVHALDDTLSLVDGAPGVSLRFERGT